MGLQHGFDPPDWEKPQPLDDLAVSGTTWVRMGDGRLIDVITYTPLQHTTADGWVLFTHGAGGSRKTNDGAARSLDSQLGMAAICMSMIGQGEGGLTDVNPPGKRGHGGYTWAEVMQMYAVMKHGVELFGNNFAVSGDSQGWRTAIFARAWAGYTFQGTDYPVQQGWVEAGETFPSPKLILGGGFGARWERVLVPDNGPRLRGNLTNVNSVDRGVWDDNGPANQGLLYEPELLAEIRAAVNTADSSAFKTLISTDERWKQLYDDTWSRMIASSIPMAWHISQLEAWYDVQRIMDEIRELETGAGAATVFASISTGNHQSTSNSGENTTRDARELALLAWYLQGDASRLTAMGNAATQISEVPIVRLALIPNLQTEYEDEDHTWEEVYAADTDTLYDKTPTKLYLQTNLTLSTSTPSGTASANVDRTWTHPFSMAEYGPRMDGAGADLFKDVLRNSHGLTLNTVEFSATITAPVAKILAGPLRIRDLYIQSDNAKVQIGAQLWIDDGVNDPVFIAGGAYTTDGFTTGSVQGPFDIELEQNATRLVLNQTLKLRITAWDAKERDYVGSAAGRMVTVPFEDDAVQSIHIAAGSREPYLEARLFDTATQNGDDFLT